MSQIIIDGKLVSSSDEFKVLVTEAIKRRGGMVTRYVPIENVVARLASYSAMWQEGSPLLGLDQEVNLRKVLVDICGMLNLSDNDSNFILAKRMPLLEKKPVKKK